MATARKYPQELPDRGSRLVFELRRLIAHVGRDRGNAPKTLRRHVRRLEADTLRKEVAQLLEMFPDGWFDCTQTISTLPEMPAEQAEHYLALMTAKSRRALFLKQWKAWRNAADDVEFTEQHYTLPEPWRMQLRRTDPIQPAFFNQLWLRP